MPRGQKSQTRCCAILDASQAWDNSRADIDEYCLIGYSTASTQYFNCRLEQQVIVCRTCNAWEASARPTIHKLTIQLLNKSQMEKWYTLKETSEGLVSRQLRLVIQMRSFAVLLLNSLNLLRKGWVGSAPPSSVPDKRLFNVRVGAPSFLSHHRLIPKLCRMARERQPYSTR